jgi:hypothetical protein
MKLIVKKWIVGPSRLVSSNGISWWTNRPTVLPKDPWIGPIFKGERISYGPIARITVSRLLSSVFKILLAANNRD